MFINNLATSFLGFVLRRNNVCTQCKTRTKEVYEIATGIKKSWRSKGIHVCSSCAEFLTIYVELSREMTIKSQGLPLDVAKFEAELRYRLNANYNFWSFEEIWTDEMFKESGVSFLDKNIAYYDGAHDQFVRFLKEPQLIDGYGAIGRSAVISTLSGRSFQLTPTYHSGYPSLTKVDVFELRSKDRPIVKAGAGSLMAYIGSCPESWTGTWDFLQALVEEERLLFRMNKLVFTFAKVRVGLR